MTRVRIHNKAWVLIGDGRKALVLRNEGDADLLDLRRASVRIDDNPPTHAQGSDAPGRVVSSVGAMRSAVEPTDWHEIEAHRFAASMAEQVNEGVRTGACREVVLVAPPKILGEIRHHLSIEAQKRVKGEVPKDLTHHRIGEIERILGRLASADA
ncbi:MAG: host attachment protein [Hyphomicrobiales bacterium]|nr:host attachment protein [Hyphomicrobiales bacterium]